MRNISRCYEETPKVLGSSVKEYKESVDMVHDIEWVYSDVILEQL